MGSGRAQLPLGQGARHAGRLSRRASISLTRATDCAIVDSVGTLVGAMFFKSKAEAAAIAQQLMTGFPEIGSLIVIDVPRWAPAIRRWGVVRMPSEHKKRRSNNGR